MTLPSSGTLSMSQINGEFGRGNNLNAYRGTTWYTDAGGSGTFSTGAISFSDFYGKRATSPTFSFTISSNQTNANLRTLAVNAGWNQSSSVVATISSGVYISSNGTGTPALTVNGSFPGGVSLTNNGYIVGMGGAGGAGRSISGASGSGGSAGAAGGTALSVSTGITVVNNGIIAGGGGGGGGGSANYNFFTDKGTYYYYSASGGGGGGGRSSAAANSGGGARGSASGNAASYPAAAGGAGTVSGPGGGGAGVQASNVRGGSGGSGGGWGSSGGSGTNGTPNPVGGPFGGGGGGNAVTGNGYISWAATGTRYGGIA